MYEDSKSFTKRIKDFRNFIKVDRAIDENQRNQSFTMGVKNLNISDLNVLTLKRETRRRKRRSLAMLRRKLMYQLYGEIVHPMKKARMKRQPTFALWLRKKVKAKRYMILNPLMFNFFLNTILYFLSLERLLKNLFFQKEE